MLAGFIIISGKHYSGRFAGTIGIMLGLLMVEG